MDSFLNYLSPFSWRYASPEMRSIWSEIHKRQLWRKIWLTLATVQSHYGLVNADQLSELKLNVNHIDMDSALKLEAEIHHDLMAELKTFASQCPQAGGILHLGATSMDIEDNADALRIREALDMILKSLSKLLIILASQIEKYADLPVMAYTHLQPAEPTTLGYRFCVYAQDLLEDWHHLAEIRSHIRGKGFKGAVGTGASFADLIGLENLEDFEASLSRELELPFYSISSQTYPRKQDFDVLSALAGLGASLHKFALDIRVLQSPSIGEMSEPFATNQVGSSAMPFKRNPIHAEKVDSLARQLAVLPQVAWQNSANSILERTLDDSANRRSILPEAFLISDELLLVSTRLMEGFKVHEKAIQRNLDKYAPFAATERLMMATSKKGADRQVIHELIRQHALTAWNAIQNGDENPLLQTLINDSSLKQWLSKSEIESLSDIQSYTGFAKQRALDFVSKIRLSLD
ncbi:MAG: adenylosuccinate lyase [Chloroflexi bacterium HGW-Chloroflexi-8]|jgi:adenylosuccinate lyase|nr:MAG: adenylosuccinate lyase [Chloroflexi bacterium HGW-Chloroflexi-8]